MGKAFDAVGVGLNATDTLLVVPHFPEYGGKAPFQHEILSPGGQVASAMVTCQRLGLRTKYIGSVGDDERGRIQLAASRNRASTSSTCRSARTAQPVGLHHHRPAYRRAHRLLAPR